jgi:hypothetical protein
MNYNEERCWGNCGYGNCGCGSCDWRSCGWRSCGGRSCGGMECIGMCNRRIMAHYAPVEEHLYYNEESGRTCIVKFAGEGGNQTITAMDGDVDTEMCGLLVFAISLPCNGRLIHWYVRIYK